MARYGDNHKGGRPAKPSKQIKVRENVLERVLSLRDALYLAEDFLADESLHHQESRLSVFRALDRLEVSIEDLLLDIDTAKKREASNP